MMEGVVRTPTGPAVEATACPDFTLKSSWEQNPRGGFLRSGNAPPVNPVNPAFAPHPTNICWPKVILNWAKLTANLSVAQVRHLT
jgi:hypothetical protein